MFDDHGLPRYSCNKRFLTLGFKFGKTPKGLFRNVFQRKQNGIPLDPDESPSQSSQFPSSWLTSLWQRLYWRRWNYSYLSVPKFKGTGTYFGFRYISRGPCDSSTPLTCWLGTSESLRDGHRVTGFPFNPVTHNDRYLSLVRESQRRTH